MEPLAYVLWLNVRNTHILLIPSKSYKLPHKNHEISVRVSKPVFLFACRLSAFRYFCQESLCFISANRFSLHDLLNIKKFSFIMDLEEFGEEKPAGQGFVGIRFCQEW